MVSDLSADHLGLTTMHRASPRRAQGIMLKTLSQVVRAQSLALLLCLSFLIYKMGMNNGTCSEDCRAHFHWLMQIT